MPESRNVSPIPILSWPQSVAFLGVLAVMLYLGSFNYLLFHTFVELASIATSLAIFLIAWNARQYQGNDYLVLVGLAYLFVAVIDTLHTLSYSGMGVFPGPNDVNLPTQLWVAARYLQAVALLVAPRFVGRRLDVRLAAGLLGAASASLVAAIFLGLFPDCFLPGTGLTPFKKGSEYAICAVLVAAAWLTYRRRRDFDPDVMRLILASIALTIAAELCFTLYRDPYAFSNELGHIAKIVSCYFLYKAIIVTGFAKPYDLIFHDLQMEMRNHSLARQELDLANRNLEDKVRERTWELYEAKDKAEEANRSKNVFLANMSHEVRTPLNGVLLMLQLLQKTEQTVEQKECVLGAIKSTRRLTRRLSDILDIARIEAGKMQLIEAAFPVEGLRESIVELFTLAVRDKGLELCFDIAPGTPAVLVGDETRVRQILFNLVGNAVKFTERGAVSVHVSPLPGGPAAPARLLFTVADTGIGIPDNRLRDIFDPFVQAEGSYTRRYQGAGLGLSIVRKLVGMMRGELAIDNRPDGTTIYLSLPFELPSSLSTMPQPPASPKADFGEPPLRILLAEDDEVSLLAGARMLEKSGYQVVAAHDGKEALERLAAQDIDLVLMDVQMPVMDGVEATGAIRSSDSLGPKSKVPIIAMTAYAMSGDRERFLAAGMDDYLSKPVDMDDLHAAIDRLTAKARTAS